MTAPSLSLADLAGNALREAIQPRAPGARELGRSHGGQLRFLHPLQFRLPQLRRNCPVSPSRESYPRVTPSFDCSNIPTAENEFSGQNNTGGETIGHHPDGESDRTRSHSLFD